MSRIVLITGASSGYGKATAKAFKDNGDTVIMTSRNFDKLENENSVYASLKNSPFDSYNHVLTLAENGYVEGNFINKYLVIKEKYRSYITFCISFFGLDYIELNDELNELKKYISDLKEDLIKELQREIEFIEKMME